MAWKPKRGAWALPTVFVAAAIAIVLVIVATFGLAPVAAVLLP